MELIDVAKLFKKLPAARSERWDLLKHFFARWLGPLTPIDGVSVQRWNVAEQRLAIVLPVALREWYEVAGGSKSIWSSQDRFLVPEEFCIEEGKLIIGVENQAVVKWAIPLSLIIQDDPPVFVSDQTDRRLWTEETTSTSVFALSQMLLNAKFAKQTLFSTNGQSTNRSLETIATNFVRLDFPDLHWPAYPTRLYGAPGILIETDGQTWIWVSGISASPFESAIGLIARTGVEWEEVRAV